MPGKQKRDGSKPLTRQQFIQGDRPPGLFGHAAQRKEAQKVQADNGMAAGVLGRIVDALVSQDNPYRSKVYSMYGMQKLVEGDVMVVPANNRLAGREGLDEQMHQAAGPELRFEARR